MRAIRSGAAAIILAAAMAACAERAGSNGVARTGVDWLDRDNTPVNVTLTFDSASSASAVIGEEGGVVSTSGADGAYFELEIPKGALHRRETITMIPVSHVDGLPLEHGGAVATVQLEPEGLRFDRPVKLTIEPAAAVPESERVGFAYITHGTDTHLYPATGDSLSMEMQLLHFSGYGFGKAPPNDPGRIHLLFAAHNANRLEAQLATELKRQKALGENADGSEFGESVSRALIEYYDGVIAPIMKIAEADDRMAECALNFYLGWLRQVQLMGMDSDDGPGMIAAEEASAEHRAELARARKAAKGDARLLAQMEEGSASALAIMFNVEKNVMKRAAEGCKQHDLTAYDRVFGLYRLFALLGIEGKQATADLATLVEQMTDQCYRWEVELSSSIDSRLPSGAWHFTLSSTAKFAPTDNLEEGPLNYVSLEVSGRPWKDVLDAMSDGQGAALLQKRDGNALRLMDYTLSKRGSRHGTMIVQKVDWKVVERDTVGTDCQGRDEKQKTDVADSLDATFRIDPPTEIVHFVNNPLPPHDEDMHEWMRYFMQFRKAAGQEPNFVPGANSDDDSGAQPQFVTIRVRQQSPGVWSAEFRTPAGVTSEGLSETGHLILRHTPKP